jgi:uncharacterized membrane protein (UPF0127 family)
MHVFIHKDTSLIIKKFGIIPLFLLLFASCRSHPFHDYSKGTLSLPTGEKMTVYIADSDEKQERGLSGIQPENFKNAEAMLFPSDKDRVRQFWMPETFMDLDIFFLTKDYYVLDIERDFPHFPQKGPRSQIPMTRAVFSRHVLEIKSSSPLAKKIKPGMVLKINY